MFQLRIPPGIGENETITPEPGLDLVATSTSAAIGGKVGIIFEEFSNLVNFPQTGVSELIFIPTEEKRIPHASENVKSAKEGSENRKTKYSSEYDGIDGPSSKRYKRFMFPVLTPLMSSLIDNLYYVSGSLKFPPKKSSTVGKI